MKVTDEKSWTRPKNDGKITLSTERSWKIGGGSGGLIGAGSGN
mgnify:CR=1 FL=1